jgi:ABC-type amino acid transport system permease subunit
VRIISGHGRVEGENALVVLIWVAIIFIAMVFLLSWLQRTLENKRRVAR